MEKNNPILQLKYAIQALSLQAEDQLHNFPDFVDVTDELLLDFDHWYTIAISNYPGYFSAGQLKHLKELDVLTNKLPRQKKNETIEDELKRSPFWKQMRSLAKATLKQFGWRSEMPPLNRMP